MSSSKHQTRTLRSGSNPASCDDLKVTVSMIESIVSEKLQYVVSKLEDTNSKLNDILDKVKVIESRMDCIQNDHISFRLELNQVKNVICNQQKYIEQLEFEKRRPNLIVSGISESPLMINDMILDDDEAKVNFLLNEIDNTSSENIPVKSLSRIGKPNSKFPRLIKLEFYQVTHRNMVIRSQRKIRDDRNIKTVFGNVYFNPDETVLVRNENSRLRSISHALKKSSNAGENIYIKRGVLYKNSEIVDKVDIRNQLF